MVHICECGLATDDLAFLRRHLAESGHRERMPATEQPQPVG